MHPEGDEWAIIHDICSVTAVYRLESMSRMVHELGWVFWGRSYRSTLIHWADSLIWPMLDEFFADRFRQGNYDAISSGHNRPAGVYKLNFRNTFVTAI